LRPNFEMLPAPEGRGGSCRPHTSTARGCPSSSPRLRCCRRREWWPTGGRRRPLSGGARPGPRDSPSWRQRCRGGVLEGFVGAREMDRIRNAISSSLTGQVTSLHVLPLPNNALDVLVGALGLGADCCKRMGSHEGAMVHHMFEHRRGRLRAARVGLPSQSPLFASGRMTMHDNAFLAEEQLRVEETCRDPNSRHGRMRATQNAPPITGVRRNLVKSLRFGGWWWCPVGPAPVSRPIAHSTSSRMPSPTSGVPICASS
jgi:hypothetical protein